MSQSRKFTFMVLSIWLFVTKSHFCVKLMVFKLTITLWNVMQSSVSQRLWILNGVCPFVLFFRDIYCCQNACNKGCVENKFDIYWSNICICVYNVLWCIYDMNYCTVAWNIDIIENAECITIPYWQFFLYCFDKYVYYSDYASVEQWYIVSVT